MKYLRLLFASFFALAISISAFAASDATSSTEATAVSSTPTASTSRKADDQQVVNINSATVDQLDTLKGIGPKKAQAIVDYRTQNGNFKSIDDLGSVKGISQKIIAENKDRLTTG